MGTQLPSPKGAQPPIFGHCPSWSNGWTKILLVMEVGLGSGDFLFNGDPATSKKGHTHITPFFAHGC